MTFHWIGETIDTKGAYKDTIEHGEIFKRVHDKISTPLYRFESRFGHIVYISKPYTIGTLEEMIDEKDYAGLTVFLYETLINEIGMLNFLHSISLCTSQERSEGYREGVLRAQKDFREAIGIEED